MLPFTINWAVAEEVVHNDAVPSVIPVGHARPGRGPTVAVAVRSRNFPSNSYFFPAAGVNASPVTGTAVAEEVTKSEARIAYVHPSDPAGPWGP